MATTHALVGMALALPVAALAPELAPAALLAGLVGGLAPDLDLYLGHRRTLHFPVLGPPVAVVAILLAVIHPGPWTIGLAVGLAAAALHAAMDVLGGGLELRPWLATADRAVYSHLHGRWLPPRRWIRYDGSPEDLGLAGVLALLLLSTGDPLVNRVVTPLLAVSIVYAVFRRRLVDLVGPAVALLPASLRRHLPERYLGW